MHFKIGATERKSEALNRSLEGVARAADKATESLDKLSAKIDELDSGGAPGRVTIRGRKIGSGEGNAQGSQVDAYEKLYRDSGANWSNGRGGGSASGDPMSRYDRLSVEAAGPKFARAARVASRVGEAAGVDSAVMGRAIGVAARATAVGYVLTQAAKLEYKVADDVGNQYFRESGSFYGMGAPKPKIAGQAYALAGDEAASLSQNLARNLRGDSYAAAWARSRGIVDMGELQGDKGSNFVRTMRELRKVKNLDEKVRIAQGLGLESELWMTDLPENEFNDLANSRGDIGTKKQRELAAEYEKHKRSLKNRWAGIVAENGGPVLDMLNDGLGMLQGDRESWYRGLERGMKNNPASWLGTKMRGSFYGVPMRSAIEAVGNVYGGKTPLGRWLRDPKGGKQIVDLAGIDRLDPIEDGTPGYVPTTKPKRRGPEWDHKGGPTSEYQRVTRPETINGSAQGALPSGWNGHYMTDQGMMTAGPRGRNQNAALDWMAGMLGAGAVD